jgi:hypothetical protein
MGARLRRSGKAGIVSLLVALALFGSAWLAYATTAPTPASYQTNPIRIVGKGFCGDKRNHSRFQLDVGRKANGQIRGRMHTQVGPKFPGTDFQGQQITVLNVSGNTASFTIVGQLAGKSRNRGKYTADVTVTNAHPDTYAISVHNAAGPIYTNACSVSGGGIAFKKH